MHFPLPDALEDDALFYTLDNLVREGKVRYYGIALGPGLDFGETGKFAILEREISTLQLPYNILDRDPARRLFALASDKETPTGFIVRSPHASGLLDGTYTKNSRLNRDDFGSDEAYESLSDRIHQLAELDFLTDNMDSTIGQIAIKFALDTPQVASVLPNITGAARLQQFAAAPETKDLPTQMLERLVELHDDYFHPSSSGSEEE